MAHPVMRWCAGSMVAMAMTWRPPQDLDDRLDAAVFVTGETKQDLVTQAVEALLDAHPQAAEIRKAQAARSPKTRSAQ